MNEHTSLTELFYQQEHKTLEVLLSIIENHPDFKYLTNHFKLNLSTTQILQAITHTSFTHEFSHLELQSYERNEFLGDALLGCVLASELMIRHPLLKEGQYSKFRGAIVNEGSLAKFSKFLGLDKLILLGRGERYDRGEAKLSLLSDVFESLLAVVFQANGFEDVVNFLRSVFADYLNKTNEDVFSLNRLEMFDPKSTLQEKTMALYKLFPIYECLEINDGRETIFDVTIKIGDKKILSCKNPSKKKAQIWLAEQVLTKELYRSINP